jgi:hypothetical protein
MSEIGFFVRGFGFSSKDGGLDITVRTTDSSHSPIMRRLHMTEEELFEMLALLGIGAENLDDTLGEVEDEDA